MIYAVLKPAAKAALERHRTSVARPLYFGEYLVQVGRITQEQLVLGASPAQARARSRRIAARRDALVQLASWRARRSSGSRNNTMRCWPNAAGIPCLESDVSVG
jgi:hypothetical protein